MELVWRVGNYYNQVSFILGRIGLHVASDSFRLVYIESYIIIEVTIFV